MIHSIALTLDLATGQSSFERLEFPPMLGPVDYAVRACAEHDGLVIGKGLFAGSILPGSNRLIFAGRSPVWGGRREVDWSGDGACATYELEEIIDLSNLDAFTANKLLYDFLREDLISVGDRAADHGLCVAPSPAFL